MLRRVIVISALSIFGLNSHAHHPPPALVSSYEKTMRLLWHCLGYDLDLNNLEPIYLRDNAVAVLPLIASSSVDNISVWVHEALKEILATGHHGIKKIIAPILLSPERCAVLFISARSMSVLFAGPDDVLPGFASVRESIVDAALRALGPSHAAIKSSDVSDYVTKTVDQMIEIIGNEVEVAGFVKPAMKALESAEEDSESEQEFAQIFDFVPDFLFGK